ncbi:poly(rC)-binding protein 3 isoform X2 [Patella vulgata]|uniref:poly(rC)-binding protein 3 isoform X2 n=1 Tax=Patella vulgata TaxID=6465 RepID=UPI00217FF282|nr:poly(rC)-binding protein 3 isoform X2 [Patella vulgata]
MATETKMVQNDSSSSTILTIRMIMQGKEVGSIIGKKGDNIKKFREESGAKINISDGSCPERIVTTTGSTENIHKAFTMISKKFEEDLQNTPTVPKPPVTLRLVVPASQCGSLIGKGGSKIKEIRESTGASIQVASEMLPNSTERAVTLSGTAEAITQCIRNICGIMLESPPKGANIPYRPKPVVSPQVIFAGGQAYAMQGGQVPMPNHEVNKMPPHMPMPHAVPLIPSAQTVLPGGCISLNGDMSRPTYGLTAYQFARPNNVSSIQVANGNQTHEMNVPNDLIGCIIGRGGQKINEIRQLSGATIKISNAEDGAADRKVTISGSPEMIGLAQYLINTSMEMHKNMTLVDPTSKNMTPDLASTPSTTSLTSVQSHPLAIPLSQLMKPTCMPLLGLNMGVYNPGFVADAKNFTAKMRVGVTANSLKKPERPKFAPY